MIKNSRQKGEKNEVAAVNIQGHASMPVGVSIKSKTNGKNMIWCLDKSSHTHSKACIIFFMILFSFSKQSNQLAW